MKAFRNLFGLLLLCFSITAYSQDHKESIHETFANYRQLSLDKDFNSLMDYIYPKLFDIVPKEQMVQMFEQMDGDEMSFDFTEMQLDSISDVFVHEEEQFALANYTGEMTMWMLSEEMQDSTVLDLMEASFAMSYEKVERVNKEGIPGFELFFHKSMFVIAPVDSQDWKFIENNKEQEALMKMLFPEPVIEHFVEH